MEKKTYNQKIALSALMCAQAVAISFLEGFVPASAFLPPGAKIGLSNVVTMFCVQTLSIKYALCVTLFKALFAVVTRGFTAGIMSLSGGILSTVMTYILIKIKSLDIGFIGVAVCSAICHNAAQLAVFAVISGTPAAVYYAPVLCVSSVLTGILTGIVLKIIMPVLEKQNRKLIKGVE